MNNNNLIVINDPYEDIIRNIYRRKQKPNRFINRLDKSNVKFNTLNPVWDNEKEDALNVFEMIDLLNEQYEDNKKLKNIIRNQGEIIQLLDSQVMDEKFKENNKIIITKEDLKTLNEALSYYIH